MFVYMLFIALYAVVMAAALLLTASIDDTTNTINALLGIQLGKEKHSSEQKQEGGEEEEEGQAESSLKKEARQKLQYDLDQSCGLWLAPSTIPGAGLGMFSGKNYSQKGIQVTDGDIVLPSVDLSKHNTGEAKPELRTFDWLWDEYVSIWSFNCFLIAYFVCWRAHSTNEENGTPRTLHTRPLL